jgi:hypothetical protein
MVQNYLVNLDPYNKLIYINIYIYMYIYIHQCNLADSVLIPSLPSSLLSTTRDQGEEAYITWSVWIPYNKLTYINKYVHINIHT